jgi:hypothetical protein
LAFIPGTSGNSISSEKENRGNSKTQSTIWITPLQLQIWSSGAPTQGVQLRKEPIDQLHCIALHCILEHSDGSMPILNRQEFFERDSKNKKKKENRVQVVTGSCCWC